MYPCQLLPGGKRGTFFRICELGYGPLVLILDVRDWGHQRNGDFTHGIVSYRIINGQNLEM